jgi:hypothetical protein
MIQDVQHKAHCVCLLYGEYTRTRLGPWLCGFSPLGQGRFPQRESHGASRSRAEVQGRYRYPCNRPRRVHIVEIMVKLSATRIGRALLPETLFLVLIPVRGCVKPRIQCDRKDYLLGSRTSNLEGLWHSASRNTLPCAPPYKEDKIIIIFLCKIWGFHGGDYEECHRLGYKNPVRTSLVTHYVSATESSRLMLCKIWTFHGCDYEECRLMGFKNPVRTSLETHYVSATEPSRLMQCKIWRLRGCDYEECRLLIIGSSAND